MFHIIKIKTDASNTMPRVLHLQFNSHCLDIVRMQRSIEGYFVTCPTIVKHLIRFDCILHVILILRPPSRYSLPVLSQAHRAGGHGEEQFLRKRLSDITRLDTQHTLSKNNLIYEVFHLTDVLIARSVNVKHKYHLSPSKESNLGFVPSLRPPAYPSPGATWGKSCLSSQTSTSAKQIKKTKIDII